MKNNAHLLKRVKDLEEENNFLKQIISHIPGNVFWKDKKGVYLGCNKNTIGFAGVPEGKTIYDLLDPETAKKIDKTDKKIMREKKEVTLEETGYDMQGKSATFLSIKAPLFDKAEKVSGLVGMSIDITRIKEAELALIDAKNKAEETNRIKSEFIYTVEHDIRAPFAGIHAMSSLLARQETDPDKKEALESIASSSKASLDYATRLLSIAKIEEEFNHSVSKPFCISELIQSVVEIQQPFANAKGITLLASIAPDIQDNTIGDPDRLRAILMNLISNSIKFTTHGHVKISVVLSKKRNLPILLEFSVEDTGIGLPPGKIYFMNENFFRADSTSDGFLPGFGLGFPVIKKFISDLHGEIKIKSEEGKGTVITFTIPFHVSA